MLYILFIMNRINCYFVFQLSLLLLFSFIFSLLLLLCYGAFEYIHIEFAP